MLNLFRIVNKELSSIEKEFDNSVVKYLEVGQTGNKLKAIYCHFEGYDNLAQNWLQWVSFVVTSNLVADSSNFEKRNLYILFSCSEPITKATRFKIENDKFAARKIVFNTPTELLNEQDLETYLNNKILLSHVELTELETSDDSIKLSKVGEELIKNYDDTSIDEPIGDEFYEFWLKENLHMEQK
ncbi:MULTISPECIES: ABC-three component system middle component 1 [unclassified Pseudoalteromonas]|uniref:ABC-three component system middle component 1 n=1 Tax=unclassified Pseudoalteromonas TaxID=194690 RepID=UPI000C0698D9|nr:MULTISPECIES: ABC-three component system middle component 1 [unclassified Pseudoalteromonas]MDP2636745.1 hypothetical protein [Pseudoalteromonas sp. 1_MG-2023]PHN88230.1 hypothetical protein CSC79_19020 [Pseudoalteromonas sp. 3D05]